MGSGRNPERQANEALVPTILPPPSRLLPGTRLFASTGFNSVAVMSQLFPSFSPYARSQDPRQWLQLTPRILATPLSLPPGLFHDESWPLVTYLPGGSHFAGGASVDAGEWQSAPEEEEEEDVLLAGLFGLTACALVPGDLLFQHEARTRDWVLLPTSGIDQAGPDDIATSTSPPPPPPPSPPPPHPPLMVDISAESRAAPLCLWNGRLWKERESPQLPFLDGLGYSGNVAVLADCLIRENVTILNLNDGPRARLSDSSPAYLLSTPTLGRDILHGSDGFGGTSYRSFFLLSSGSGLLHRFSLDALLRHSLDYWSEAQSADRPVDPHVHTLKLLSPPSECLLVDCPSAPDQLCCLLSEAGSGLTLLALRQAPVSAQHRPAAASGRVVWRFELPVGDDVSAAAAVNFAVPTLVPSEGPIVLLPDALGNIHAVFLKDGSPLPGSPAPNPFRNNRSDACSSVLTPGVAIVDEWLNRYVVFFSNCGRAAAVDLWNNFTIHDVVEEALDSAEVLSSLHARFDQRQETSHVAASGRRRRDLLVAPSASVKLLKGAQRISAPPPGELSEVAFLLLSQEGDMQLFTAFQKNSSFRSMLFSPCILNTEGVPLVPLQTVKCLPVPSVTAKMHQGPKLQACEMNVPLDLSHAPLLATPKGRVTVLLFSPSGRLLVTSSAHLESISIPVQQDTSISSWLLVFSYLPIVLFVSVLFTLLDLKGNVPSSSDFFLLAPRCR
ncbi:hypothetical protein SprV_0802601600 [Sparganum proliferum]